MVVPKWLITEIQKICFDFIWKGKDRIKRTIMYQDYGDGGLRMINFELFVKTQAGYVAEKTPIRRTGYGLEVIF